MEGEAEQAALVEVGDQVRDLVPNVQERLVDELAVRAEDADEADLLDDDDGAARIPRPILRPSRA
jgi:hypothetical protein